jgi:hypothetical protein
MMLNVISRLRRLLGDERGQVLPITALMTTAFLGMAAIVVDIGDVYYSYNELVTSTNAAAMAGAEGLPSNTSTVNQASVNANLYSAKSGSLNAYGNLNVTSVQVTLACLTGGVGASVPCVSTGTSTGASTANAIQVKQTATVPLFFAKIFGPSTVTLNATASALMAGGAGSPYNVAIIVDTTDSMVNTKDTNCSNQTRLNCALSGVQTLLKGLNPCAGTGCGSLTTQNYANSLDRVALFSFPNFQASTASSQYNCSSGNATGEVYTFPQYNATSMTTMPYYVTTGTGKNQTTTTYPMTYEDTYGIGDNNGFVSDYRASDSSTSLSTSSNVVNAVGGNSSCGSMQGPSGQGTYYAGVIYAAQAALTAEQVLHPNAQNVLILVSDGAATSKSTQMANSSQSSTAATNNGSYPSYVNECAQAVTAAQYATSQGTTVYSVAYGSPSTGCTTDSSGRYTSPCNTMQDIASSSASFYSDYNQSGSNSTCTAGKPVSSLNDIFVQIASNLTVSRLITNEAFGNNGS